MDTLDLTELNNTGPYPDITPGVVYLYTCELPPGCKGKRYRVERFVVAVPQYQWQVLVEALDGPDTGLWFVVTPANFRTRYLPEAP